MTAEDRNQMRIATGWIELGNYSEAAVELAGVSSEHNGHPEILRLKWEIAAHGLLWSDCIDIGFALVRREPDRLEHWLKLARSFRMTSQIRDAYDLLWPLANRFDQSPVLFFELARYACLLEQPERARHWFSLARTLTADDALFDQAKLNTDFDPLWR